MQSNKFPERPSVFPYFEYKIENFNFVKFIFCAVFAVYAEIAFFII